MGSILIVEPDVATSDEWAAAIHASGHSVHTASGTRDALILIREGGIDVVVIDVYESRAGVIQLARAMDLLPDAPPIVLISGSPAAPTFSARIGATTFLPKPCEPSEIVTAVGRLLGRLRPVRIVEDELPSTSGQLG
jgi:DNA-binding NtrC family response regulator